MTTRTAGSDPETDSPELKRLFVAMARIRSFEDAVMGAFNSGEIRGTTHLCSGQEAASVGVCEALGQHDVVAATFTRAAYEQASGRRYLRARRPELYSPLVEPHPPGHVPVTSPGWTLAYREGTDGPS